MGRKIAFRWLWLPLSVVFLTSSGWSQDVLEFTRSVEAEKVNGSQQEAIREAVQAVAWEQVEQIVGSAKAQNSKDAIENKIIKQSGKFILSARADAKNASAGKIVVSLRFSPSNLRQLLLAQGLLHQNEGPSKILPMIAFQDRVHSRMNLWWTESAAQDKSFLAHHSEEISTRLKDSLRRAGFYVLSPNQKSLGEMLPKSLRNENPKTSDFSLIGELLRVDLILKGYVRFLPSLVRPEAYVIDVKWDAVQVKSGRVVAELVRSFDCDPGPYPQVVSRKLQEVSELMVLDLVTQLQDSLKRGVLDSTSIRLVLKGEMRPSQVDDFKKQLSTSINSVKSVKERLFEPGQISFEVETSANSTELAKGLADAKWARQKVEILDVSAGAVVLRLKH